jgi:hypothetical protein
VPLSEEEQTRLDAINASLEKFEYLPGGEKANQWEDDHKFVQSLVERGDVKASDDE